MKNRQNGEGGTLEALRKGTCCSNLYYGTVNNYYAFGHCSKNGLHGHERLYHERNLDNNTFEISLLRLHQGGVRVPLMTNSQPHTNAAPPMKNMIFVECLHGMVRLGSFIFPSLAQKYSWKDLSAQSVLL